MPHIAWLGRSCAIPVRPRSATHDAFLQAWRKWATPEGPARFEQWFDRILVNACRNRLRRTSRWQATDISAEVVDRGW